MALPARGTGPASLVTSQCTHRFVCEAAQRRQRLPLGRVGRQGRGCAAVPNHSRSRNAGVWWNKLHLQRRLFPLRKKKKTTNQKPAKNPNPSAEEGHVKTHLLYLAACQELHNVFSFSAVTVWNTNRFSPKQITNYPVGWKSV